MGFFSYSAFRPLRAIFSWKNTVCKLVFLLLLPLPIFLLLIGSKSFVKFIPLNRNQSSTIWWEGENRDVSYELSSAIQGYTSYTINRLGLQPLSIKPLDPKFGVVINDVLSFKYPIDLNETESKCEKWRKKSWVDLISAYDEDISVNRTLLIFVVSSAENFAQREAIRKTWGASENFLADWLQLVFLIGSVSLKESGKQHTIQNDLEEESEKYRDIIQVDVTESYENLTLKSISLLYWAWTRCSGAQLVLKCDDDTYINFDTLNRLLGEEQFSYPDRIYGVGVFDNKPQRLPGNKYHVSRKVWPWLKYPTFVSGGAYILGKESIRPLLAAAQTTPLFSLEDVYVTGLCARKAKIPFLSSQRIYERFVPKRLNPCFVRNTAMWQTQPRLTLTQSHLVVKRIYKNSLYCRSSCKYVGIC